MTPEKALSKAEKEKKGLFLQDCLELRRNFTPMVHSADGMPEAEALAAQKRLREGGGGGRGEGERNRDGWGTTRGTAGLKQETTEATAMIETEAGGRRRMGEDPLAIRKDNGAGRKYRMDGKGMEESADESDKWSGE